MITKDQDLTFQQYTAKYPYMVPEYLAARFAWMHSPISEVARKWQYMAQIYAKHYKPCEDGNKVIPISEEAIALAKTHSELTSKLLVA